MNKTEAFFEAMTSWIVNQVVSEDSSGNEILDLQDAETLGCEVEDYATDFKWSEYPCFSVLITTPSGFSEREAVSLEEDLCVCEGECEDIIPESEYPDNKDFYYTGVYSGEFDHKKYREAYAKLFADHIGQPKEILRDRLRDAIESAICVALSNSPAESDKKICEEHWRAKGW